MLRPKPKKRAKPRLIPWVVGEEGVDFPGAAESGIDELRKKGMKRRQKKKSLKNTKKVRGGQGGRAASRPTRQNKATKEPERPRAPEGALGAPQFLVWPGGR